MSKSPADSLRKLSDGLQSTIDDKFRDRLENTPKRAREAESQREEGRRLQQLQDKMRALADAWDAGTVPDSLVRVKTRNLLERLLLTPHMPSKQHNESLYNALVKAWIGDQDAYIRAREDLLALGDPNAGQKTEADLIKDKERELIGSRIPGYFPTPKAVVEQMLDLVRLEPGMRVLEPSAGKGNIADAIRERCPEVSLDVVEWNYTLREILKLKGHNVIGDDCLELDPAVHQYDVILQNPPFENFQDIQHVQAMFKLLNPEGVLVSVMSESPFFRKDKKAQEFREWFADHGYSVELPDGAFKESERSTGVKTRLVVLEKPIEKPLSKIEKPDQDEIQWLARQWSLMVGGSVKDSAVTLASEFEMANEWKLTDLEEQRSRLLKSLEHWEERPESKPGHEHYDWWENEQSNYRKMAWLLGVKISILTKSAEQRAGRDEELAWVAQVNDLARKIDAKADELNEWLHPSTALDSEELKPLMDEYVGVASGGTYQNISQVVDAVKARIEVGSTVRRDQAYIGVITSIKDGRCHGRITQPLDPRIKSMMHFASELKDLVLVTDTNQTAIVPVSSPVTHTQSLFRRIRLNEEEHDHLEYAYDVYARDVELRWFESYSEEPGWVGPDDGNMHINFEEFVCAGLMEFRWEDGFRITPKGWQLLGKPDPNTLPRVPLSIIPVCAPRFIREATFKRLPQERVRPEPVWVDATVQLELF